LPGGLLQPAHLGENNPKVAVRLGGIGLEPQRLLEMPFRFRQPARLHEDKPQFVVRLPVFGSDPQSSS